MQAICMFPSEMWSCGKHRPLSASIPTACEIGLQKNRNTEDLSCCVSLKFVFVYKLINLKVIDFNLWDS